MTSGRRSIDPPLCRVTLGGRMGGDTYDHDQIRRPGRPRPTSRPDLDGGARLRRTHLENPRSVSRSGGVPGVVEARRRRRRGSDHRAGARRAPSRRQSDAGVGAPGVGADRGVEPAVVLGGPISVSVGLSFFQPTWRAPAPAPRNATRRHRCYARNDSPVNLRCSPADR